MRDDPVVITAAKRTPMGSFQGALSPIAATRLGALAVSAVLDGTGGAPDEVMMGNVLSAGLGQNPARQAMFSASLPQSIPATTISKVCGSGMKAVIAAHDSIIAGTNRIVVAGGMESMSNAPYLLPKARAGLRLGHGEVKDHMFADGLEDAYEGRLMGTYAEDTAAAFQLSRAEQDHFALRSLDRARQAQANGAFDGEIIAISESAGRARAELAADEQPGRADPQKIPTLKPAFREGGTVTAANSSSISDGAAALVLMRLLEAERRGLQPVAKIVGHAGHARKPSEFTVAPAGAVRQLLDRLGWRSSDVDLYEINEAFAVVALVAMRELGLPAEVVNIHGGACALGHPIGASGARIMVTLLHAMRRNDCKRGIATLCIGGGEALAVALECV